MFERFTEKAIKTIMLAQEESRRLGHNFVGTEQILLGLIATNAGGLDKAVQVLFGSEDGTIAAKALVEMGVSLQAARVEVEKIIGKGDGNVDVEIPFTPRAKRVLELSWDEAYKLKHKHIGTEHLLLALIRESDGVAAKVLQNLNVNLAQLEIKVFSLLKIPKPYPFETPSQQLVSKFTDQVRNVIAFAQEEARNSGHNAIGTDQLLLGLIREPAVASQILSSKGVTLDDARREVEKIIGQGSDVVETEVPFTPRAIRLFELSNNEANNLGSKTIGTEHLLLALVCEGTGVAARVLENFGVNLTDLRKAVLLAIESSEE